jgi:serine/threonine protein kinase
VRVLGVVRQKDIDNEIRAATRLCQSSHPNIVPVLRLGQLIPDSILHYIDMELCSVSLESYMAKQEAVADLPRWERTKEQILNIYVQIVDGLDFIHEHGEAHRDLSPPNGIYLQKLTPFLIFSLVLYSLKDHQWKITDFGFASTATSSQLLSSSSGRGKPSYRASELLQLRGTYSKKIDIWAVGAIVFEMITGQKRFAGDWEVSEYARTPNRPLDPEPSVIQCLFLVPELLEIEPSRRPSATRLRDLTNIIEFLISVEMDLWENIAFPEHIRLAALTIAINSNRQDIAEVVLNETPFFPDWWSSDEPRHLVHALEENASIAVRISEANVSFNDAALSASKVGNYLAIRSLANDLRFDFRDCKDARGQSCLDLAITHKNAEIAVFLFALECPFLLSSQSNLEILFRKVGFEGGWGNWKFVPNVFSLSPQHDFEFHRRPSDGLFWSAITKKKGIVGRVVFQRSHQEFAPSARLLALSPNGRYLAWQDSDTKPVSIIGLAEEPAKVSEFRARWSMSWMEFSPDSKHLLFGTEDSPVLYNYSLELKEPKEHLVVPGDGITHFNISLDGRQIAVSYTNRWDDSCIKVWSFRDLQPAGSVDVPVDWVHPLDVQLSQNGKKAIVHTKPGEFVLWNQETRRQEGRLSQDGNICIGAEEVYFKRRHGLGKSTIEDLFHSPPPDNFPSFFVGESEIISFSAGEKYLGVISEVASVYEIKSRELAFRLIKSKPGIKSRGSMATLAKQG